MSSRVRKSIKKQYEEIESDIDMSETELIMKREQDDSMENDSKLR